jgi:hypothetical protein
MRPDQTLVTLQREGANITARTSEPLIQEAAAGTSEREHPYSHVTTLLRQRGLFCTVEYGLPVVRRPLTQKAGNRSGQRGCWLNPRRERNDRRSCADTWRGAQGDGFSRSSFIRFLNQRGVSGTGCRLSSR